MKDSSIWVASTKGDSHHWCVWLNCFKNLNVWYSIWGLQWSGNRGSKRSSEIFAKRFCARSIRRPWSEMLDASSELSQAPKRYSCLKTKLMLRLNSQAAKKIKTISANTCSHGYFHYLKRIIFYLTFTFAIPTKVDLINLNSLLILFIHSETYYILPSLLRCSNQRWFK